MKLLTAQVWLAYRHVKHPRVLTYDLTSSKYEACGVVATELEKLWELPKELNHRTVAQSPPYAHFLAGSSFFFKISLLFSRLLMECSSTERMDPESF